MPHAHLRAASLRIQVIDFDEKKGPGGSPGKGFPGLKGMGMGMGMGMGRLNLACLRDLCILEK
jgi:hypothetical protein